MIMPGKGKQFEQGKLVLAIHLSFFKKTQPKNAIDLIYIKLIS